MLGVFQEMIVDKTLLLLIGAPLASAGLAQPPSDAQARTAAEMRTKEYDAGAPRYAGSQERLECLVRKSTNIRVCHSREVWHAIAQRIERRDASRH